ncbi:MAG: PaaI family thioesterase [Thermoplasmata archaeon]
MARLPARYAPEPRPVPSPKNLRLANRMGGFHHEVGFAIDPDRSGPGRCTVAGTVAERHLNVNRVVHGGVYATILDTAMGGAVVTTLAEGETTATTSLYVEFLRSARRGDRLVAQGRILRRGRHLAFVEGTLTDGQGRALGQGHGTWYIWSSADRPATATAPPPTPAPRTGARSPVPRGRPGRPSRSRGTGVR